MGCRGGCTGPEARPRQLRRRHAPGTRAAREASPGRPSPPGGSPGVPHVPMRRNREGHDRGRRLVFVPPQPPELVPAPELRRPPAVRVRRDGFPAEGLAARAAHGRGVDVRRVRREPGRAAPVPLRIHERAARGTAAGHGERIPPPDRRSDGHQLRRRPRGLHRCGRRDALGIPEAVLSDAATRRGVREARAPPGRQLEGQSAPSVRARPDGRGADGPLSGPAASRRPGVRPGSESRGDREGGPPVRGHLLCPIASTGEEVVPGGPRDVPRPSGRGVRPTLVLRQKPRVGRVSVAPHRGSPNGGHGPPTEARVPGDRDEDGAPDGARCPHDPGRAHAGRGAEAERVPRVPGQGREGPAMKIGEIVAASVIDGLVAKLQLGNPEELKIAFPVIVEGARYDFYCLVEDVLNEESDIADQLAGSTIADVIVPRPETHEGYGGPIFYSKAKLRMIQLVDRETKKLSEPQTIPPYFSSCRHATRDDVERIYEVTETSATLGTITGVEPFHVQLDMKKLVEKPFAIFGRTGTGKSILNKLVCAGILSKDVGSVLIFDMHSEYGVFSATDKTESLKFFFPGKVEIFSLDPKNREAKPFVLDTGDYGTDQMVYLFVANILSRRLFELYTERNEEYPRLVLFLEEAHKFLSPEIAPYAHTFSRLARETRKFNLILALVDQRPSRISDEVRSQLANRLVMSLKEPSDVEAALAGVPDKKMWENIIAKLPLRTVAVIGDAIRIPTVIDVLDYDNENVREHILGAGVVDEGRLQEIANRADDVFGRG